MNKPEQLRLAADIIEKGLEWEARCVDPKCPKADCKQWQKANSELLNIISAQMEQGYLISRDFGKTWHPCEKDEPSA